MIYMNHCAYHQAKHADTLTRNHIQMGEAKRMIDELKSERLVAAAAANRDFHEQLEAKDEKLARCHELIQQTQTENDSLKTALDQATLSGTLLLQLCICAT